MSVRSHPCESTDVKLLLTQHGDVGGLVEIVLLPVACQIFFQMAQTIDNSTGLSKIPFILTNKIKAAQHFQSIIHLFNFVSLHTERN